ncbi:unnamed protein product [Blepharisma stoltei]|uniref:Uncharacterized protein n=1 Tax=Blepharisma stoltei TaxID=1481888 RepID=A0AAU9JF08_9CILI|nr:unnamed protein product [Blepharisma stoltei]
MLLACLLIAKWALCLGFSIEDETVLTIEGCPGLYINDNVQLLNQSPDYANNFQPLNVYIKKLFDWNHIFGLLEPHLHESLLERYKKITSSDMQDSAILFPSAIWLPDKKLYLVTSRVFLFRWISFLYVTFYDSEWNEVTTEDYVGKTKVPGIIPISVKDKDASTGPEDPRLFVALNNEIFVIFNRLVDDRNRIMHLYQFSTATSRKLYLEEDAEKQRIDEKNWTPLIIDKEHLYFVYNFKNLQIIDCTAENEPCKKVSGKFDPKPEALRGGSPFVRFTNTNYYVSLSYTHIFLKNCHFYRPVFVVMEAVKEQLSFKMIYQSEPFDLNNRVFLEPFTNYKYPNQIRDCMMVIPSSIASWNFEDDIADLHVTIEDHIPVVARVKGLAKFVEYIINMYEYGRLPENDNCAAKFSERYFLAQSPKFAY